MIAKDCTEPLSAVALSVGLFRAANAFRVTWSERVRHRNALTEIAWEDAVQDGNVYRSVREKQGNVVYRQRVLQTVTSLRVVSLAFRGHDLLKIANINPQQKATLSLWKKISSLRERRKWSL